MADTKGHKQTSDRVEFCRVPNCDQTDYGKVRRKVKWQSEAHHILCIAQVDKVIASKRGQIKKVIDESKWCINKDKNMMALPLWGTTVMFYCDDFSSIKPKDLRGLKKAIADDLLESETGKPPFRNLPQHNYGHSGRTKRSSYNKETEDNLKKWIKKIKVEVKKHSVTGPDVGSDLNDMADDMRDVLKDRGKRKGCTKGAAGTHDAWMNPAANWYEPFSMAEVPKKLPKPKLVAKIVRLAQALWRIT